MIALTSRLNERDETIIQLQEELDAFERIHRETEGIVDKKKSRIAMLEGLLKRNNINFAASTEETDIDIEDNVFLFVIVDSYTL